MYIGMMEVDTTGSERDNFHDRYRICTLSAGYLWAAKPEAQRQRGQWNLWRLSRY